MRQIAENAGVDGAVVAGKVRESKDMNWGYDAQENKYRNLVSAGIIDPTKVVRTALQDASSVAGLLITTEAMVADALKIKQLHQLCLIWAAWAAAAWAAWAAWAV